LFSTGFTSKLLTSLLLFYFVGGICYSLNASTVPEQIDSSLFPPDSLQSLQNSKATNNESDTTASLASLEFDLIRHAKDSIVQDLIHKKVYLYGNAEITYGDINLKAAYIAVDFNTNTVFAKGVKDSTGKIIGTPIFKQGDETFEASTLTYDFITKKGIIHGVRTKNDQGFLHGDKVKKMPDNSINVKGGYFTTCNLPHPHFEFRFNKARVIPNKIIVTGPVYMQIEGVPVPLALPFAVFPNNPKRQSGIIMPTYGESPNRGFYLEGGGFFWSINDKMTLKLTGDIYTGGSWKISPVFTYRKRYKYSGNFSLGLSRNIISTKDAPDYSNTRDFSVRWTHTQDAKARPNSSFSANVNIISSNFVKYNVVSVNDYLSNEFQSSVAYQKSWAGKYFLTVNASHRQNTKTHQIQITLPEISFTVNRFYPFRSKNGGHKGLLSDLSVSYSMNSRNTINATDTTLFKPEILRTGMQNGMIHKIPISLPMKLFKYFTLSTSINITDRMYTNSLHQTWRNDTAVINNKTVVGYVKVDTIPGFNNVFDFSLNSSVSTKIYGMVRFKKGPLRAIRHVLTPRVGLSYIPDFGSSRWNYRGFYYDALGNKVYYSKYDGFIYGTAPTRKSGNISFNLANTLEIKVPTKKDTVTGLKKIPLIEGLAITGYYDFAKDSLRMSNINMSGRTRLWKGLTIQYASTFSPYVVDSLGHAINKTEWEVNRRLLRINNSSWNLSLSLSLSDKDFNKKEKKQSQKAKPNIPKGTPEAEANDITLHPENYVDWKIPWSLNLNYHFTYTNVKNFVNQIWTPKKTLVQTLGFSGQMSLTPNWKFSFNSGWDFTNKQLAFTSMNLYRNLHCWEMRFSWIPIGPRKSWNFTINVKAAILQDLKLTKKKDFRDF